MNIKIAVVHPLYKITNWALMCYLIAHQFSSFQTLQAPLTVLNNIHILEAFQFGFGEHELAHKDMLLVVDNGDYVILIFLDLSAPFNTLGHYLLITQSQQTKVESENSASEGMFLCIPPLLPVEFTKARFSALSSSLHTVYAPILIRKYGISFSRSADDIQLNLLLKCHSPVTTAFNGCLLDIKYWMPHIIN